MCAGKGPFHRRHAGKPQNGLMGTVSGTARGLRRFLGSANVGRGETAVPPCCTGRFCSISTKAHSKRNSGGSGEERTCEILINILYLLE